jgi:transcriptional regulator with XRE-family HTH domain
MGVTMTAMPTEAPDTEDARGTGGRGVDGFDGMALHDLRVLNLMTQAELALAAGVSPGEISHLECDRRRPTVQTLKRLCHALKVGPEKLLTAGQPHTTAPAHTAVLAAADPAAAAGIPEVAFRPALP